MAGRFRYAPLPLFWTNWKGTQPKSEIFGGTETPKRGSNKKNQGHASSERGEDEIFFWIEIL